MSVIGTLILALAFLGAVASAASFAMAAISGRAYFGRTARRRANAGLLATAVTAGALVACCGIIVFCFVSGDISLQYVVLYRSDSSDALAWLYLLSGLWGGRSGSLLFWATAVSACGALAALRVRVDFDALDCAALALVQGIAALFVATLLLVEENMPFAAVDPLFLDESGELLGVVASWGMNALLEHWAMAVHPPALLVGYAGLSVPFAYSVAALAIGDSSDAWIARSSLFAMGAWLFLGIGIGLGSVWAYDVLGWGGYWGWDAVENASLIPWLFATVLIHSFLVRRKSGHLGRWCAACACLAFAAVMLSALVSRCGIIESVHSFDTDPVSLFLFSFLIGASLVLGFGGLVWRWRALAVDGLGDFFDANARGVMHYVGSVILVAFAVVLGYLTLAPVLPTWLPLGGSVCAPSTFDAVARPVGVLCCGVLAVCVLLPWRGEVPKETLLRMRVPLALSLVLFCSLLLLVFPRLLAVRGASGSEAPVGMLLESTAFLDALAVVGLLVASLLLCACALSLARGLRTLGLLGASGLSACGAALSHGALAVVLVGLIGSSLYSSGLTATIGFDEAGEPVGQVELAGYELRFEGSDAQPQDNHNDTLYVARFSVHESGELVGEVSPSILTVATTGQQKCNAGVLRLPREDGLVVYRGVTEAGELVVDVRVVPLVSCVWAGFALLVLGTSLAAVAHMRSSGRREPRFS